MTFTEALAVAQRGYDAWSGKPHNARWVRRVDGTPIPNDLVVNIAEAFVQALTSQKATLDGSSHIDERAQAPAPVAMVLSCPACQRQHIDRDEWATRPHRSHLCECGHIWRPADVATVGVEQIATRGENDSPAASPAPVGGEAVDPAFTRELAGTLRTIAGGAEGYINFSCEVRRKSSVVMTAANILERYAALSPDPTEGGEDE